jgi:predicted Fe-Mo cluster-binding NifX family protein
MGGEMVRKIAVATEGNQVAQHFGRCPSYTIAMVEDGRIVSQEVIANPGHEPGFLPGYLGQQGVEVIIAGGMGPRAEGLFAQHGIETVVGAYGPVDRATQAYLAGAIELDANICDHDQGHDCNHG